MKNIQLFLRENKYFFFVILLYLCNQYIFYFSQGNIVLGGEGNYWMNYKIYLENGGYYTWLNYASGIQAASINTFLVYPLILSFITNDFFRSFFIIATIYVLPFAVMYFLLKKINPTKKWHIISVSLFFVSNPFSINFLYALNPWGVHTLFIYPLYFLILYTFYKRDFLLFYIFGLVSFLLAYTFTNPPQMVLILAMLPVYLLVIQLMQNNRLQMFALIKKSVILYSSFLLFHLWWLVQWFLILPDAQKLYTQKFARSWLESVSKDVTLIMKELFSLTWSIPRFADQHFLAAYYNNPYIKFLSFIPFFVVLYWLTLRRNTNMRVMKAILIILFLLTLLLKAANPPFPGIMFFCFDHIPLCYLFKTAPEKFGVTFVFFLSILLFYILNDLKIRWLKWLFYGYVFVALVPILIGQYIPDYKTDKNDYVTRKYIDYDEFKNFRKAMDAKQLDFRLISYPNGGNYQVKLNLRDNLYYTGHDPILMNMHHTYFADHMEHFNIGPLFSTIGEPVQAKLLYLYSIRYIHLNRRLRSWFANISNKNIKELEKIFNSNYKHIASYGEMDIYETPDFLPQFHTPKESLTYKGSIKSLAEVLQRNLTLDRPAIFFSEDNTNKIPADTVYNKTPIIEYKKINATKYKVLLHRIQSEIPLIFNESFHRMWKAYVIQSPSLIKTDFENKLLSYKTDHANKEDQADKSIFANYFNNGWISAAGPAFVSKLRSDTIQNNNIDSGSFYDTTFIQSIPDSTHLKVNGYAQAWMINPEVICSTNPCRKNADETYEIELIIEFMPQKIFYWNFSFSLLLLSISTTIYLLKFKPWRKLTYNS